MQMAVSGGKKSVQEFEPYEKVTFISFGVLTLEGMSQFIDMSSAVMFQTNSFKCFLYYCREIEKVK